MFTSPLQVFIVAVCVTAIGGLIIAAVATASRRTGMFAGAAIGFASLTLISAALPEDPQFLEFALWSLGGLAIGAVITLGLRLLLIEAEIAGFKKLGPALRRGLATQTWAHEGSPKLTRRDVIRRWIITISAAAGSVMGALLMLPLFWESALGTLTPRGILALILLSVFSVLLIGPVHERVIAKGLAGGAEEEGDSEGPLFKNLSWTTAGRFVLVLLALLILDLGYSALEQSMKDGSFDAVSTVYYNFVTPVIVSYYWTAAIQLRVRSVWRWTTWPATLAATITLIAMPFLVLYNFGGIILGSGMNDPRETLIILGLVVLFAFAMAVLLGFVATGLHALLGGLAIDHARGKRFIWVMLSALLVASSPPSILMFFVYQLPDSGITVRECLSYFPPAIGWLLALRLSGFTRLIENRTPSTTPAPAVVEA